MYRDRVAQRLAGEQYVRIAGDICRNLLHGKGWRGLDQNLRRIFVVYDIRVGRTVDIGVVALCNRKARKQDLGLVEYIVTVRNHRRENNLELDQQDVAEAADGQVTDVEQPGAGGSAIRIRVYTIRSGRQGDNVQRSRLE